MLTLSLSPGHTDSTPWPNHPPDKPDVHGSEWLRCNDRYGRRGATLPASLAHPKRRISNGKGREARDRAEQTWEHHFDNYHTR